MLQIDPLYSDNHIDLLLKLTDSEDFELPGIRDFDAWQTDLRLSLQRGEKLALGAWVYRVRHDPTSRELAGFCILSPSKPIRQLDLEVEIIYVKNGFRYKKGFDFKWRSLTNVHKEHVGYRLLNRVQALCLTYGYERLIVINPTKIENITAFLLNNNFFVQNHDSHREQYKFVKRLETRYNMDPYDTQRIVSWVCRKWGIEINEWLEDSIAIGSCRIGYVPDWSTPIQITVCSDVREFEEKVDTEFANFHHIVFLENDDPRSIHYAKEDILFISPNELKTITNNDDITLRTKQDIVALMVPILPNSFGGFRKNRVNAFIDGGDYGSILKTRLEKQGTKSCYIAFTDSSRNNRFILGVAPLLDIYSGRPMAVWDRAKSKSTFSTDSFNQYRNLKTTLTSFEFHELYEAQCQVEFENSIEQLGWCYVYANDFYDKIIPCFPDLRSSLRMS